MLTSCKEDDSAEVIKDNDSGYFWVENLRTKNGVGTTVTNLENGKTTYREGKGTLECELGDTLVVKFTPKNKYTNLNFSQSSTVDNSSQVGNMVLTSNMSIGEHTLVAKAICQTDGYNLSAQQSFTFNVKVKPVHDLEAGGSK